jgi:RHS repeat-associated protein
MDGPWLNDLTARDNRYKFNGIERVTDLGLNMDLAPFRSYDPAIGRWWQADPLAALAPEQSPYRFGFNSPMNFGDPLGLFETREEAKEYKKEHGTHGRVRQLDDGTFAIVHKKSGGFISKSSEHGVFSGVLAKRGGNVGTISPYNPTLWDRMAESDNFFVSIAYNQADVFYAGFQALNPLDTRVMHLGHGEVTQNDAQDLSVGVGLTALGGVVGGISKMAAPIALLVL